MPRAFQRKGFTLIELLVVIAIISILMAMMLPAIQKVRAAADKLICQSNLRQIGIALHHYVNDHGALPPGGFYPAGTTSNSWSVQARILPYIEQDNVQKLIDFGLGYDKQPVVTQMQVPLYICPSEPRAEPRVDGAVTHFPINYVANMGTWHVYNPAIGLGGDGVFPVTSRSATRGVTLAGLYDGTSYTIGFSEARAYTPYLRDGGTPNGPDVAPPASPAAVVAYGGSFKADSGHTEWVDARVHQTGFTGVFTPNTKVVYTTADGTFEHVNFNSSREGKTTTNYTYAAVTARSFHTQSVNCLLMDGSVQSVADSVPLNVWRAYVTRSHGEVVEAID